VLENPDAIDGVGDLLAVSKGGLTLWGAVGAGAVAMWLGLRRTSAPAGGFADAVAPGCVLALGVGRLGCYSFGCDFGARLGDRAPRFLSSLGTFPRWDAAGDLGAGSPAWLTQRSVGLVDADATSSLAVHPVQLYEAVLAFGLVVGALLLTPRKRFDGEVAVATALAYCAGRFVLELMRGDPERFRFGPSVPSGVALGVLALTLLGVWLTGTARLLPSEAKRRATLVAALTLVV
jgi:phosphatidylglycerol:prolipoprotein diacylglycerol transferase